MKASRPLLKRPPVIECARFPRRAMDSYDALDFDRRRTGYLRGPDHRNPDHLNQMMDVDEQSVRGRGAGVVAPYWPSGCVARLRASSYLQCKVGSAGSSSFVFESESDQLICRKYNLHTRLGWYTLLHTREMRACHRRPSRITACSITASCASGTGGSRALSPDPEPRRSAA